jgi:hypothetical protein
VLQIIITILSSSVKFAVTFPLAIIQFNFSFLETILWTNVGGILGVYFFAFLSEKVIAWWNRTFRRAFPSPAERRATGKRIFTKRNRRIVRIKQRYGLIGLAITTPLLLSIPLGTFLVVRYYRISRRGLLCLILANVGWSLIFTSFYMFWDELLLKRA